MSKSESCDAKYIYQNLEATKDKGDKIKYIADTLERCAVSTIKKKRKMSGYNCFVKVSVKKGQPFMSVIKAKGWSTLSDKQKNTWKHHASEDCPPRLWQE